MARVVWKLAAYLEKRELTTYKLAQQVQRGRENTVYRLVRQGEALKRLDLEVLADILSGLRSLTGQDVTADDLLEFRE
ncbi:hypothetical protein BH24DEI2_BH24DEI2_03200 [soil metagenome]